MDEKTGIAYFRVRVIIKDDLARVMRDTPLYPGMQAEVMIVTGARAMLEYVMKPFSDSFNRAFREK